MSPLHRNNVNSLRNINARDGWKYQLWHDDLVTGFIERTYGAVILRMYKRINPKYQAARADLARYLICYHYGGVYLDLKSLYTRRLDTFINPNDEYILTGTPNGWHQWHIMCSPGHSILVDTITKVLRNIDDYDLRRDGVGKEAVINVTGPKPYTIAVNANRSFSPGIRHCEPHPQRLLYDTVGHDIRLNDPLHYSHQSEPLICR